MESMSWFSILKKTQEWTGELPDRKKRRLKKEPTIIVDLPQLSPPDGKEELDEVLAIMEEKELDSGEIKETDKFPKKMLFSIVGKKQSDYKDLVDDLKIYTIKEKMKHKRARPYQISDKIDKPKTDTLDSPSYPSGHTIEAIGIATFLSDKFPDKKKELMDAANNISLARLQMGVHFPSDIEAGKQIGEIIGRAHIGGAQA